MTVTVTRWLPAFAASIALDAMSVSWATSIRFSLDQSYTTSAGVFSSSGTLIRTLWSAKPFAAGAHVFNWDDCDDAGKPVRPGIPIAVRLLYHRVNYHWDGVIGNTSAQFTGATVRQSLFPPAGIAISGDRAVYAVGYNEGGPGMHGFALDNPQHDWIPLNHPDAFSAWSLVATDGKLVYWVNAGGLSKTSFLAAATLQAQTFAPFAAGQNVCLQYNGSNCYPGEAYAGVIDLNQDALNAPSGLAVQAHGDILAVAHGPQGIVKLFDKTSGALLRTLDIPKLPDALNQLASAPNGDLWVIERDKVVRYTQLQSEPVIAGSITGLSHPLAVAVDPGDDDRVLVADGGPSQQIKAFDRHGGNLWTYGESGGYANDPRVSAGKLWFYFDPGVERTALAIQPDGSFWVIDTCNDRMLHISRALRFVEQIAYLPTSYSATADPKDPSRVFANYLEYDVPPGKALMPGASATWSLARNWLAGLPYAARPPTARNGGFTGLQTVVTMSNHRTYALTSLKGDQALLELPPFGPARLVGTLSAPVAGDTPKVLYENGDLGFAATSAGLQRVYRQALTGFSADGDPIWEPVPHLLASVATAADVPTYKGVFSGATGPRFPVTSSNKVVFFDQSVAAKDPAVAGGYHLGAVDVGGTEWLWKASPVGTFEQPGAFPTNAIDAHVSYGGNMLWAVGRHIVYGYHGEGFTDPVNGKVGQANRFMHFYDDGLFIGRFGVPTTRASGAEAGVAGNSFSNILIDGGDGRHLLFFHNDESQHGGVHRWTIDKLDSIRELAGAGLPGSIITLR